MWGAGLLTQPWCPEQPLSRAAAAWHQPALQALGWSCCCGFPVPPRGGMGEMAIDQDGLILFSLDGESLIGHVAASIGLRY